MKYDLGALAAEALIKQIKTGEKTGAKIKTEIIERASVKDIRKN